MKMHNKTSIKKPNKFNFKINEVVLVLIIAIIVISYEKSRNISPIEAERITRLIIDDHKISFANNSVLDENKLKDIQKMDYKELKEQLKAKKDFCLYLEDEKGNVILAKGSQKLSKDGGACG